MRRRGGKMHIKGGSLGARGGGGGQDKRNQEWRLQMNFEQL